MLDVSEAAQQQITDYFKTNEVAPIRVFLNQGGCGGPSLALALDEKRDNDESFEIGGFVYLVEKALMEQASPIKVDFTGMGFTLTSSLKLGGGCSGCGGSCDC
jgi:Fe-S cluster assembly iron-binding protein IscA